MPIFNMLSCSSLICIAMCHDCHHNASCALQDTTPNIPYAHHDASCAPRGFTFINQGDVFKLFVPNSNNRHKLATKKLPGGPRNRSPHGQQWVESREQGFSFSTELSPLGNKIVKKFKCFTESYFSSDTLPELLLTNRPVTRPHENGVLMIGRPNTGQWSNLYIAKSPTLHI